MDIREDNKRYTDDTQNRRTFLGKIGKSAAFIPSLSYMLISSETSAADSQLKESDGLHSQKFYDDILKMTHEKMRET